MVMMMMTTTTTMTMTMIIVIGNEVDEEGHTSASSIIV